MNINFLECIKYSRRGTFPFFLFFFFSPFIFESLEDAFVNHTLAYRYLMPIKHCYPKENFWHW